MLAEGHGARTVWDQVSWPSRRNPSPVRLLRFDRIEEEFAVWTAAEDALRELSAGKENDGGRRAAHDVLTNVCRRLAARDWTGIFETTDDFVVYWTDFDLEHLEEGLTRSARPLPAGAATRARALPPLDSRQSRSRPTPARSPSFSMYWPIACRSRS